ncbi:hypothetical protein [Dokdonella soli]|uniref:hypothetical protein n=1 Tax=Dokdonella soli TaxID=529810 RepID=UPI0031E05A67
MRKPILHVQTFRWAMVRDDGMLIATHTRSRARRFKAVMGKRGACCLLRDVKITAKVTK